MPVPAEFGDLRRPDQRVQRHLVHEGMRAVEHVGGRVDVRAAVGAEGDARRLYVFEINPGKLGELHDRLSGGRLHPLVEWMREVDVSGHCAPPFI